MNMLEIRCHINSNPDFRDPTFGFINSEADSKFWMLYELSFCDKDYIVNDVIPNLVKVNSGLLERYDFGYDATVIDYHVGTSVINYNYWEDTLEIDSKEIFQFLSTWGLILPQIQAQEDRL